jgi:hypothetical protein
MKSVFIKATPLVAALLALIAFGMFGLVAYLEGDWIKGAMVALAVFVLAFATRPFWKYPA